MGIITLVYFSRVFVFVSWVMIAGARRIILSLILPVISATPDWQAIWSLLEEQMACTREFQLGRPFRPSESRTRWPSTDGLARPVAVTLSHS